MESETETTKSAAASEGGVKTYELGFLITPLLPEEQAIELVATTLKPLVVKLGGQVVSDDAPRMITLAYPIRQVVEHKSSVFSEAYFAALRFTLPAEAVNDFSAELKKLTALVRTLLIVLPRGYNKKTERPAAPVAKPVVVSSPAATMPLVSAKPTMSAEAIDQEIDKLI